MGLSIEQRMQVISKLAIADDDGKWDASEVRMLGEAAKLRDQDAYSPEGVAYLKQVYNDPGTQFAGDGQTAMFDLLVKEAKVGLDELTPRGAPVHLENTNNGSEKFYKLSLEGKTLTIQYGKIGTDGQTQVKDFPSALAAQKEYGKKLREKLREGYELAGAKAVEAPKPKDIYQIRELDYGEVEALIEKHFGKSYEVVACEEWSNDSQHRFDVDGKVESYDKDSVAEFKATGDGSFILGALLNELAAAGEIEKGKYLVTVCW